MQNIALTGSIGSGKSIVSRIFKILGIPVFNADREAKECYSEPAVLEQVIEAFGKGVADGGKINVRALSEIVFNDPESLRRLNSIIHPRVWQRYLEWRANLTNKPYLIMEAALIFEAGLADKFDQIITVYAEQELCINRVMERDGITNDDVRRRMGAQWDAEEKVKRSDLIIYNDDKQLVIPQILKIHYKLLEPSD